MDNAVIIKLHGAAAGFNKYNFICTNIEGYILSPPLLLQLRTVYINSFSKTNKIFAVELTF